MLLTIYHTGICKVHHTDWSHDQLPGRIWHENILEDQIPLRKDRKDIFLCLVLAYFLFDSKKKKKKSHI